MKKARFLSVFLAVVVGAAGPAVAQNGASKTTSPANAESALDGDWRGESVCVVRESACHDEDSLYRFSKIPDKPGRYSLKADKIVDGKPVTMGTSECSYDRSQRAVECAITADAMLRFTVNGDTLHGTMTIQGSKLWRKLTLKKVGS
jgi:hypothetical protein